eukprot:606160-Alexandrium_andersonii.AAC.1
MVHGLLFVAGLLLLLAVLTEHGFRHLLPALRTHGQDSRLAEAPACVLHERLSTGHRGEIHRHAVSRGLAGRCTAPIR